ISKLRYYDEHGLIPNLKRSSSGLRKFSIENLEAITIIECLKTSSGIIQLLNTTILKNSLKI
ncbi:MAG: MerR family DNA-binding transcriptional regulator, partial [Clostridiales bacterium]|nr:MerR family DNA-binding transcriptional regulator [Clostridiales bacterium]